MRFCNNGGLNGYNSLGILYTGERGDEFVQVVNSQVCDQPLMHVSIWDRPILSVLSELAIIKFNDLLNLSIKTCDMHEFLRTISWIFSFGYTYNDNVGACVQCHNNNIETVIIQNNYDHIKVINLVS